MSLNRDDHELLGSLRALWAQEKAQNSPFRPRGFDPEPLYTVQKLLVRSVREAFPILAEIAKFDVTVRVEDFGFNPGRMFGTISDDHVLYARSPIRGFRLHEPQVTGLLAHLIDPKEVGEVGYERCSAFVQALFAASGDQYSDANFAGLRNSLSVQSECRLPQSNATARPPAIDLLITWKINNKTIIIAVENKIDHFVERGQLRKYEKGIENKRVDKHSAHMFLVTKNRPKDEISARKNRKWRHVSWFGLLRHWELKLIASGAHRDSEFNRLRRALWHATVNV